MSVYFDAFWAVRVFREHQCVRAHIYIYTLLYTSIEQICSTYKTTRK